MPFRTTVSTSQLKRPTLLGVITPAEAKVLSLLRHGESNRGIAQALVLSTRTVESHVSSLLAKTGCRNRTQLTLWSLGRA